MVDTYEEKPIFHHDDALGVHPNSIQAKVNRKELAPEVRRRFHENRRVFNSDQAAWAAWDRAGCMAGLPAFEKRGYDD